MAAIHVDRMFKMAKDSYPQPEALKRLRVALVGAMVIVNRSDDNGAFAAAFKEAVDSFIDRFGTMSKKVEELAARLLRASNAASTSTSSAFASQLAGLHVDGDLFGPLRALRLPAAAPEDAHLEVALAAQRLHWHDQIDQFVELVEFKIFEESHITDLGARIDDYILRKKTLKRIIKKHVMLAGKAAARPPAAGPAN